jgi:hypothetical protein
MTLLMEAQLLPICQDFLLVDIDLRSLVASHIVDILIILYFGVKVLFVSHANLRVKLSGFFLLLGVVYLGQIVRSQLLRPETPILSFMAVWIGMRLLAIKIIYMVIDWEQ